MNSTIENNLILYYPIDNDELLNLLFAYHLSIYINININKFNILKPFLKSICNN